MKIAYIVETYTEGLGYIDNVLPGELAQLGNEVCIVTAGLPPYYQNSAAFFGELTNTIDSPAKASAMGVNIHRLSYTMLRGRVFLRGLRQVLAELRPDVVLVRGLSSPVLAQVIFLKFFGRFRIFTSTGLSYSAVPFALRRGPKLSWARIANLFSRYIPGMILNQFVDACVASTEDGKRAAVEFYGLPERKVEIISLGVDTSKFYEVANEDGVRERCRVRGQLGISDEEVICIWTGRMTGNKGICLLAEAVETLCKNGYNFRAVFIGDGPEASELGQYSKSQHIPFMPWAELAPYYRAADLAVWPKSITTSTLDASACGLPVIMSDHEGAMERWKGIGSTYAEGSLESLMATLITYYDDELRRQVGSRASVRMKTDFSWTFIATKFQSTFLRKLK